MVAFSGELRFRESHGENGTRQRLSAVGHVEFLNARSDPTGAPEPDRSEEPQVVHIPF
jgi:hypothetical protein